MTPVFAVLFWRAYWRLMTQCQQSNEVVFCRHQTRLDNWGQRMYFAAGVACGLGQGLWLAWKSDANRQHA